MADIQSFINMLSKTNDNFVKGSTDNAQYVDLTDRKIRAWFKKDGSFDFMYYTGNN